MEISIDDEELGFVSNGKTFSMLLELEEGEHTLTISKAGNSSKNAKKEINLKGDMTFKCNISHGGSISLKDIETTDDVKGSALVVPDLTGLILSDAEDQLKQIGFDNISDKGIGGTIWNEDNWLVAEQSIEPNTAVDKHQEIILTCQHLNDYFNETFSGKNVSEIQEIADNNWYTVSFQDENEEDMNAIVESMKPEARKEWIATKAKQYKDSEKKALVTIKSTSKEAEKEATDNSTEKDSDNSKTSDSDSKSKKEKTKDSGIYYTTNSKKTYKNGNSGVYSYVNNGPNYDIYLIIDFNDHVVYHFLNGNGDETCDKVPMTEGDLNSVLIITYHDGEDTWQNGLCFKRKNQPNLLLFQDSGYFELEFTPTDLEKATKLRDARKILEY
ncbi:MAG: PASTA domain-containing protein [Solobacterium sp.]|nr:PASTA domain-containing protein [Solobacterium sp.]